MRNRLVFLAAALVALATPKAHAHFLFIYVGPSAEAGRWAEVFFSEQAEAGDPTFIDKIAHTELQLHTTNGSQPLQVHRARDRLRACVPVAGSIVVDGTCQYGVIARTNQTPFLLRHYPRAIAGKPAELETIQRARQVPLDIVAQFDDDSITFIARQDGKPVPNAVLITIDAELDNHELSADGDGRARWTPPRPGKYSVYTRRTIKQSGQVDGKDYAEIREFATLAFSWPLERRGPDPEAVAQFQEALAMRAQWKNFPGFSAKITGQVDGRSFQGTVQVKPDGSVGIDTDDSTADEWAQEQLQSIATHRIAASHDRRSAEVQPVLQFGAPNDRHPLGRLLLFDGGQFASSYRVKDKQITVVNRHIGKQNMTITVLDNDRNEQGHYLPRSYTVQYWNAASGDLERTETIQDRWHRIGQWDLPSTHTVSISSPAGHTVRTFTLSNHELIKP